ncbi:MAG: hypothetical protein FD165_2688 [Gammaproteobacteria bacterium]|nr:MAG: hypothetical protein FD165_2688 [Gammaproteobacteria bacterium]TND01761.1 MAG: hypothetical protein FD120_2525 [Gammaproteobacteria bacterium]
MLFASLAVSAVDAAPHSDHQHPPEGQANDARVTRADAGVAWAEVDAGLKAQFTAAFRAAKNTRPVFEKYLDKLSVRAMLDFLEIEDPRCHGDAHELGKALYASNRDLGKSLMLCGDGCTNACMHGVVGEAFGGRDYEAVVSEMSAFCTEGEIARLHKPGNCAHGMGHALMLLTRHDLGRSIEGCERFTAPGMDYYCATGVFMEYRDELDNQRAAGKTVQRDSQLYPCDTYTRYPAACYRYLMSTISAERDLDGSQLIDLCLALADRQRLGCFHGLGAVYSRDVADNPALLAPLCLLGGPQDQIMCIEGVIEKLADFDEQRAITVCNTLDGENRQICLVGARDKMYPLDKATMHLYR